MLTKRQQLTIQNLNYKRELTPEEIIAWAKGNLKRSWKKSKRTTKPHAGRHHSREYYTQIINHFTQQGVV